MHKNFRTALPSIALPFQINHSDLMLCMGSCFAEHMAQRLQSLHFQVDLNPFGILYNPISLAEGLHTLLQGRSFGPDDLFEARDLWHSFAHHSRFSHPDPSQALASINSRIEQGRATLQKAKLLIITFGTAFVFKHLQQQRIVGNCHKLPSQAFERFRLSPKVITETYAPLLQQVRSFNPELQVLLTVSPVRHLKDGLVANQRSKASLLLASAHLTDQFDFVHYFPAYELLQDDLRDYRFYAPDLIHPSTVAIDYIWEYFSESLFEQETIALNQQLKKLHTACHHRAFQPQAKAHQHFLRQQLEQVEAMEKQYPFLKLAQERALLSQQLIEEEES